MVEQLLHDNLLCHSDVVNAARQPDRITCGALVVSLDFELQWGVRDLIVLDLAQRRRLLRARGLVPRLLDVFEEFSIHVTWATVGLLFARSKKEAEAFRPLAMPKYSDPHLTPESESVGDDERDDPYHYAPSLIRAIASRPHQEIGCHSFSHYYCMEPGQCEAEFESDLNSAIAIASNSGHQLQSFVFPRNQVRPGYLSALQRAGILAYRSTETAGAKAAAAFSRQRRPIKRLARWLDSHVDLYGPQTAAWPESNPAPLAASRYLRASGRALAFQRLRMRRIEQGLRDAAEQHKIFHLWWHPEDFADGRDGNLRMLRHVLALFDRYRAQYGMLSFTMAEAARYTNPK